VSRTRLAGLYAVVATVLAVALAVALLAGPYRAVQRSDYMTYHVAARIVLGGDGDCLYDAGCQAAEQRELIGEEPSFERGALPYNSPPWMAALLAPLGALPLPVGFAIFTLLGLAVLALAAWQLALPLGAARPLAPLLVLTAWPTVMGAVRGQSTLLVAGLLGVSVAWSRYASGAALGMSALKPTLAPLWGLWQLTGGHWRAVGTALAVLAGLAGLSLIVVGPTALADYPRHLLGVAAGEAVGVHPEQMVNWRGVAARTGAGEWLMWAGTAATLLGVAYAWLCTRDRALGAAAAFFATPLVLPHANQHEAILAALGMLLLVTATRGAAVGSRLAVAAIGLHAVGWAGVVLSDEASAWLLFGILLGGLAATAYLAGRPNLTGDDQ
jgi:hypothetical protein